jgi:hypothetical protein
MEWVNNMSKPTTNPLLKTLSETEAMQQRILALAEMEEKQEQEGRETAQACQVVRLPLWPEVVRAVPNVCLRSALFGAIRKGRRRLLEQEVIAAIEGIEISYTGPRLDQGDLDVWESVLHIVRDQALGNQCRVTSYALLMLMGKKDTGGKGGNREILHRSLMRLGANMVEISVGKKSYAGSLIDEVYRDKETREYVIALNPKLRALFEPDQYTQVQWDIRRALDGKPLAQWLYGFYASHAKPFPLKVETLQRLCGSESDLRRYRQTLGDALDAVAEACEANGEIFTYQIENNLVAVDQTPSKSQGKHLVQNATRKSRKISI